MVLKEMTSGDTLRALAQDPAWLPSVYSLDTSEVAWNVPQNRLSFGPHRSLKGLAPLLGVRLRGLEILVL